MDLLHSGTFLVSHVSQPIFSLGGQEVVHVGTNIILKGTAVFNDGICAFRQRIHSAEKLFYSTGRRF